MKKEAYKTRLPLLVERVSDGEILRLNRDNETYSFVGHGMHRPYKYTYGRLFEDRRCRGEFREFRGADLDKLTLGCIHNIRSGKDYALFVLKRMIMLPTPTTWGNYLYNADETLKKRFDFYLGDANFLKIGYTPAVQGPFEDKQHNRESWIRDIANLLKGKEPEKLIFYLRKDLLRKISTRIIIPTPDFYGGLTDEEAEIKYGKKMFRKMTKHLRAITVSIDRDGKERIPYSDLNYAHKKATGQKTTPEEWD